MKVVFMNIREFNNSEKQDRLRARMQELRPNVICLQETRMSEDIKGKLWNNFWNDFNIMDSPTREGKGGIVTLVSKIYIVTEQKTILHGSSDKLIIKTERGKFSLFNIYASSYSTTERAYLWGKIKEEEANQCLILCGEFNMTEREEDRVPRNNNMIKGREKED